MSSKVTTNTVSAIEDRRITIGGAQIARVMSVGTSWSVLRFAFRFGFDDAGANVTGTPLLRVGVLSSPSAAVANGPLSSSTSHFVGITTRAATWTRTVAGGFTYYDPGTGTWGAFKRVGSTNTTTNITAGTRINATPATLRHPLVVEITKGSPNFTVGLLHGNASLTGGDVTEAQIIAAIEAETMANMEAILEGNLGVAGLTSSSATVAADEADGALNAICIGWQKTTPLLHVSEIVYRVIAS